MPDDTVSLIDIYRARRRLHGRVRHTQLVASEAASEIAAAPVFLKLEHSQTTGSFKLRGATNAVVGLSAEDKARGVVGVSTGNHGRGLAFAARHEGVRCVICMSRLVPKNKVEGIEAQGAEVHIVGRSQDEAQLEADRLTAEEGLVMIPPFDHADVIAGQGTLGLEIVEDLPDVANVVVPLSGGGLIAGVARAVKGIAPGVRLVGVTMARGAAMHESLVAGRPVQVEEEPSLADALGGGIGLENRYTFAMVRELVDETLLVTEEEIAEAIRFLYRADKQIVEGSGAVGIAAIIAGKLEPEGATAVVLSGCNIDMTLHAKLIAGEPYELTS